jgi:DNA-binding CsgD family transcriptional regulator
MASTGVMQSPVGLVGRERECAAIDHVVDRALEGESGSLVLRGDAGIGKTALLERAAGRASEMLVLRCGGIEAESNLAFAGLYGLVRPILDELDELPGKQGAALAGALGLAASAETDRFLVSAGVLGLLAAAAENQPVLCLVDDAQWLDHPSADALVFSARRLRGERLAMLFAARLGEERRFDATGLPELLVDAVDARAAASLLAFCSREAAPSVRERLLGEAAGNPLALLELPAGLSDEQLAGDAPLPDAIPLTPRLQGVFRQRIDRLPQPTQTALLIVAADNTGDVATVLRAGARSRLPADALDCAETADLVRTSGGTITFRHPLVRSALYDGATLSQRQRAHSALADVLAGEEHADRRVWHQAMATLTADEEVAAALEASARRSRARAAHSSAATALLRAAELSTDEDRRTRRIAAAAQAAWDAGQPDRAREAVSRALPVAGDELKARLLHLSGVIEALCGSLDAAIAQLLEGADVSTDPSLTLELLLEAAEAASFTGRLPMVVQLGERAASLPVASGRDRLLAAILTGFGFAYSGQHELAQARLAQAVDEADALDDPRALMLAALAASIAGDMGAGLPYATRAVEGARRLGLLSVLPQALQQLAMELNYNSSFALAYAAAEEGYRLSLDVGHGSGWHLANMATAEASLGKEVLAREHAEEVLAIGQRSGSTFLAGVAEWTLAFLDLTTGRPAEAADRLLALTMLERQDTNPLITLICIPDTIEAAVRCGRGDELGERYAAFEGWTRLAGTEARRALLARCQAMLAVRPPDEAFGEAIAVAHALPRFQRARTELLYGEWLRRERRRQEAREHLRAARELFRSLGAVRWEERAEAELRASGETARKRDPSTLDDLTPQELQIAGLVTQGLTNREIAAQLYLSPRTIDYHLRKVFSKLGITTRTELVRDGLSIRQLG